VFKELYIPCGSPDGSSLQYLTFIILRAYKDKGHSNRSQGTSPPSPYFLVQPCPRFKFGPEPTWHGTLTTQRLVMRHTLFVSFLRVCPCFYFSILVLCEAQMQVFRSLAKAGGVSLYHYVPSNWMCKDATEPEYEPDNLKRRPIASSTELKRINTCFFIITYLSLPQCQVPIKSTVHYSHDSHLYPPLASLK
jgi:hypothetical protein